MRSAKAVGHTEEVKESERGSYLVAIVLNNNWTRGAVGGAIQTCIFLNPPDLCKDSDTFRI